MTITAELGHGEQQDEAIHFITEGAQVLWDVKCWNVTQVKQLPQVSFSVGKNRNPTGVTEVKRQ